MNKKVVAISTLTALTSGIANQAIATPSPVSTPTTTARNVVVPVEEATPTRINNITPPESIVTPQFSQDIRVVPTVPVTPTPRNNSPINPTPRVNQPVNSIPENFTPLNDNDIVVRATDIQVVGATQELQQIVRNTIRTRIGGETSQSQLNGDVVAILNTGFFQDVRVNSTPSQEGLKVIYQVQPIVVNSLQLTGNRIIPLAIANDLFKPQVGTTISPAAINLFTEQLKRWYSDNGYSLAQVVAVQPNRNGVVQVEVAEGVIGNVKIRFVDKDGKEVKGRTQDSVIRRDLKLKSGDIFSVNVAKQDLQQLYQLGLFETADVSLDGNAENLDVTYELIERPVRGFNVGGGYSDSSGIFGTISYNDRNFGGNLQQVGLNVQVSRRDLQFDTKYSNPYQVSEPNRPGYSVDAFRRRNESATFDDEINLPNGDRVHEGQFGGGVTLTKPITASTTPLEASVGLNYTRTSIRDNNGTLSPVDAQGNPLSFSGTGIDDLVTVSAGISQDRRDNTTNPTTGSVLSLSSQQSIPVGNGNILMNRLQANYSQYAPINLLNAGKPEVLAFNVQGGTTIGDLPPYMAFNLGGLNSVRGYSNGEVGSGRSYVLASAEYRFPIYKPLGGVVFADFASDLGSADTVPGEPGVVREKPGIGFGYGAGVRVNSPIGILRADYGFNDQGESQLQFGIGQRF